MATIVMLMSTDQDIIDTQLSPQWGPAQARYSWNQVSAMDLGISTGHTIVVIAHGNNQLIGNSQGQPNIDAATFLALIQGNMQNGAVPAAIFISACGETIAGFAAGVRIAAEQNQVWANTRIFGHCNPVAGPVPPPNTLLNWVEIYQKKK
ncbi:MAG: hypothetical protein QM687_08825 [Ferruginibacter sp.]